MNAKEMFETIGWEIAVNLDEETKDCSICYTQTKGIFYIEFLINKKRYDIFTNKYYSPYDVIALEVSTELHKAINQQCNELGWL